MKRRCLSQWTNRTNQFVAKVKMQNLMKKSEVEVKGNGDGMCGDDDDTRLL